MILLKAALTIIGSLRHTFILHQGSNSPPREGFQQSQKIKEKLRGKETQSLKQPLSSRATERNNNGDMILDFPSVPQSILLGLQSNKTTKKAREKKPSNSQRQ